MTATVELHPPQALTVLTLDGHHWLLPQSEVYALESLLDIDPEVRASQSIGALALAASWWPVYSLSGELQLLHSLPAHRHFCLLLDNGADRFGLAGDQVEALKSTPTLFPLPASMAGLDSPIQALVLLGDELGYVTNTERLAAWLAGQLENANA